MQAPIRVCPFVICGIRISVSPCSSVAKQWAVLPELTDENRQKQTVKMADGNSKSGSLPKQIH